MVHTIIPFCEIFLRRQHGHEGLFSNNRTEMGLLVTFLCYRLLLGRKSVTRLITLSKGIRKGIERFVERSSALNLSEIDNFTFIMVMVLHWSSGYSYALFIISFLIFMNRPQKSKLNNCLGVSFDLYSTSLYIAYD